MGASAVIGAIKELDKPIKKAGLFRWCDLKYQIGMADVNSRINAADKPGKGKKSKKMVDGQCEQPL